MNAPVAAFQTRGPPVVSVDTKKELVGDVKNGGRAWRPPCYPALVRTDDFADKPLGQVTPSGVDDRPPMSDG